MIVAVVAAGMVTATWLLGTLRRPRSGQPVAASCVSVIVPARNEAGALPTVLSSLARLTTPAGEVIVVDDESSDDTAAIARAHGARVVASRPPAGWLGKPAACHAGAAAASGTHLLFLDADTWLDSLALDALLAEHHRHGGLVSVQPHHVVEAPYEELSSYPNAVAMLGSGAFAIGRRSKAAFGPCLLTTAADYHRVGGHAAVCREVIEDIRLAQRFEAEGLPVTCFGGGDAVRYRMYPGGFRQLADGWTKNLAAGATAADPLAVAGTVLWIASHAAVAAATLSGLTRWALGWGPAPVVPLAAWGAVAVHQWWLLRRIGSFRAVTAIGFPAPLAFFVGLFARSAVRTLTGRAVDWRGRAVSVAPGRRR
jgi:4,4'-diaponeurosporenoate glycosyltransferase